MGPSDAGAGQPAGMHRAREHKTGPRRLGARHPSVPIVLSFCSGFVDVTCYLGLFHSFTAFVTGTLIILCSELLQPDGLLWLRIVIVATFLVSAIAWIGIVKRMIAAKVQVVRICLALECLFLLLFMASALALPVGPDWFSPGTALALVFATIAMSLQNALMQLVLHFHVPTTVMTGNFLRFLISTGERLRSDDAVDGPPAPAAMNVHYGWSLLSFIVGGVLGAAGILNIGFWGLLLPAGVLAVMAVASRD